MVQKPVIGRCNRPKDDIIGNCLNNFNLFSKITPKSVDSEVFFKFRNLILKNASNKPYDILY
jgi:hypothetical protein